VKSYTFRSLVIDTPEIDCHLFPVESDFFLWKYGWTEQCFFKYNDGEKILKWNEYIFF